MTLSKHRFGHFEVRPSERALLVEGKPVPLGARAFDVLVALAERCDRVVSSDELFRLVWPGVVVEENNLRQQVAALRKALGSAAIVTVPGRGYRLAIPDNADEGASLTAAACNAAVPDPVQARPADRPSIAVLPFQVLSAESSLGFLADGLVEDVIALLARVPGFLVISRASTFEFRKRNESIASVAEQLGVRYVVEGSVRPVGPALRVSTQLVEAAPGRVLWSGRLERSRDEAPDLQEAIARGIISELEPELTRAEIDSIRRNRPNNVSAWGHYHQGVAAMATKGWTEDGLREARHHLRSAFEVDPTFALARAHFAVITAIGMNASVVSPSPAVFDETLAEAECALLLNDGDPQVLGYVGCALADLGQLKRGEEILQRALLIDPSNAQAHVALGATQALRGQWDEGIERMRYGMQISPRDRRLGFWGWVLGLFLLRANRAEDALQEAMTSARRDSKLHLAPIVQAIALQRLGRGIEAKEAFAAALRLRPTLTKEEVAKSHGALSAQQLQSLWGDDD